MARREHECLTCGEPVANLFQEINHCDPAAYGEFDED